MVKFEPLIHCQGVGGAGCLADPPALVERGKTCATCRRLGGSNTSDPDAPSILTGAPRNSSGANHDGVETGR